MKVKVNKRIEYKTRPSSTERTKSKRIGLTSILTVLRVSGIVL